MTKGQLQIPSQLMMNAISFALITVVIIGTLIHFQQYQVTYQSRTDYRQAIDLAENMLSSKCLAYVDKDGRVWRGILDNNKLGSLSSTCIQSSRLYYLEIVDENGGHWNFGSSPDLFSSQGFEQIYYPVVIRYPDTQVAGKMVVTAYDKVTA